MLSSCIFVAAYLVRYRCEGKHVYSQDAKVRERGNTRGPLVPRSTSLRRDIRVIRNGSHNPYRSHNFVADKRLVRLFRYSSPGAHMKPVFVRARGGVMPHRHAASSRDDGWLLPSASLPVDI